MEEPGLRQDMMSQSSAFEELTKDHDDDDDQLPKIEIEKNSCRCCVRGAADKDLTLPYTHMGKTEIYYQMLKECFSIHLSLDNGDCGICWVCVDRLRDAVDFKLQVLEATERLGSKLVAKSKADEPKVKEEPVPVVSHKEPAEPHKSTEDENCLEDNSLQDMSVEPAHPVSKHDKQQFTIGCAVRLERLQSDEAPHASHACIETSLGEPRPASRVEAIPKNTSAARIKKPGCTCDTCGAEFTDKTHLIKHIQEHINQPEKISVMYFCPICSKKFSCKTLIAIHVHTTKAKETFICDTCKRHFSEKSDLIKHIRSHNGYPCETCNKSFKHNVVLLRHIKKTHIEKNTFNCIICDQQFDQYSKLKIHKRIHDKEKSYCKKCDKYFADRRNLIKHLKTHSGAKPFKCELCFNQFTAKSSLIAHRRVHTGEKLFKCEICSKSFTLKTALTRHKNIHNKSYNCNICNKNFAERSQLVEHKKIHAREKPYRCQECNMQFRSSDHLKTHKITHGSDRPYSCDICKASFKRKPNLAQHNKKHEEKRYSCSFCDKRFAHKHQLEAHEKTHTGAKPFICDQCGAQFTQNFILKKHKRKHIKDF